MSLPAATITWSKTNERTMTVAGANATIGEMLVALKAMFDNDSTFWQTSDYSLANGTLEVKRRVGGSPAGEYASIRFLFFGGQTPNAAALTTPTPTAATTSLYFGGSVDAATTGPAASYASAAPYTTKYMKAALVCTNSDLAAASSPKVCMVESTEGFVVCLHDSAKAATVIAGYLLEDTLGSQVQWMHLTCCGAYANATAPSSTNSTAGAVCAVPQWGISTHVGHGNYWNTSTGTCRLFGRVNGWLGTATDSYAGSSGNALTLMPVAVAEGALGASPTAVFFGYLRQLRLGPQASNLQTMTNLSAVQQAIAIGTPVGATGWCNVWCDQVA